MAESPDICLFFKINIIGLVMDDIEISRYGKGRESPAICMRSRVSQINIKSQLQQSSLNWVKCILKQSVFTLIAEIFINKVVCKNEEENKFFVAGLNEECLCFRCKSTGKWFSCPNGDQIDFSLGNWQSFKGCKVEDWWINGLRLIFAFLLFNDIWLHLATEYRYILNHDPCGWCSEGTSQMFQREIQPPLFLLVHQRVQALGELWASPG